jgi:hypothetical protein
MNCPHCNAQLSDLASRCSRCGKPVTPQPVAKPARRGPILPSAKLPPPLPQETVIFEIMPTVVPALIMLVPTIAGIVLGLLLLANLSRYLCMPPTALFALVFLLYLYDYTTCRYRLTDRRVEAIAGLLFKHNRSIPLERVQAVEYREGLLWGSVIVRSAAPFGGGIQMHNIRGSSTRAQEILDQIGKRGKAA